MSTALTVQDLGREKVELIKNTVAKGATDLELELFLHACKHTGLDPLMKQIYAIKRWSQADQREVMSFQTGIDGYRLIADRTGKYAGSSDAIYEEKDGRPLMAQVTVLKIIDGEKCAFTASARWEEYVQKNRQMEPTSMWKKMPYLMLAKCAEAQALRKAFPMELSGLYTNEEMVHLDSEWKESAALTPSQMLAASEAPEPLDSVEQHTQPYRKAAADGLEGSAKAETRAPANQDALPPYKGSVIEPPLKATLQEMGLGQADLLDKGDKLTVQDYISRAKASESVRECSEVGNMAERDADLPVPDLKAVRAVVSARMKELGGKK